MAGNMSQRLEKGPKRPERTRNDRAKNRTEPGTIADQYPERKWTDNEVCKCAYCNGFKMIGFGSGTKVDQYPERLLFGLLQTMPKRVSLLLKSGFPSTILRTKNTKN